MEPQSPVEIPAGSTTKAIAFMETVMQRNLILFAGYGKIQTLLATPGNISKEDIHKIIIETMEQIS